MCLVNILTILVNQWKTTIQYKKLILNKKQSKLPLESWLFFYACLFPDFHIFFSCFLLIRVRLFAWRLPLFLNWWANQLQLCYGVCVLQRKYTAHIEVCYIFHNDNHIAYCNVFHIWTLIFFFHMAPTCVLWMNLRDGYLHKIYRYKVDNYHNTYDGPQSGSEGTVQRLDSCHVYPYYM